MAKPVTTGYASGRPTASIRAVGPGTRPPITPLVRKPAPSIRERAPAPVTPAVEQRSVSLADWLWLGVALLLSLAVRIPFFRIPLLADEGGYAYATTGWLEGTGQLYADLWISRPQGIFFIYAGILDLFGGDSVAFRFAAWIAIALTTVAVWGFARIWASPWASTVAALFFAVMSGLPNLEGFSANSEMFMGFPIALAALWLLRTSRTGWNPWHLVGIGLLLGIATSVKPAAAVMFPVTWAFILKLEDSASLRERLRRSLFVAAGITIVGILSLLHGWYLGWNDFIYATFIYRVTAQSSATVGLQHNLEAIGRLVAKCWNLVGLTLGLLFLLRFNTIGDTRHLDRMAPWPSCLRHRAVTRRCAHTSETAAHSHRLADDGRLLLKLWILGSLFGVSIGGDWWSHYLIQVVAPFSIWIAISLESILQVLHRRERILVWIWSILLLIAPFWVLLLGGTERMTDAMFGHPGYPAQDAVAAYLREHTDPGTPVYVAFDQASIYYLADRPPAYRHLYDQELRGIPGSYSDIISIIRSDDRPEYIVATRQPGPFPDDSRAFWLEVGQYYELETTIDDVPIYRDRASSAGGQETGERGGS
ncbi:MAG TPA: glycosyltransferase family 39 protein [Thermomicrobiales bacterium]|nr:glycosyltransferase family 39 protein [Thermomicrobiales bacterium]